MMRLTVDLDENELARIQEETGIRKKSPAVREALGRYVRDLERRRFLRRVLAGETDYPLTNEEIEDLATYDAD